MNDMSNTENPKEYLGREKDCVSYIPMRLMLRLAKVHKLGASKYGQKNWRVQPVRMSTYYNGMFRHMVDWFEGGVDQDAEYPNEHPLLHVIACCLIVLDGIEHESIQDDRAFAEVKTGRLASKPTPEQIDAKVQAIRAVAEAVKPADVETADVIAEIERRVPAPSNI